MSEDGVCCEIMAEQLTDTCEVHERCPEQLVGVFSDGRVGLRVPDGGTSMLLIAYCPWCGAPTGTSLGD